MAKIIGLCGYAGSGKDALGAILVRKHGFQRIAFADAVKEQAIEEGWSGRKDDEGRRLLQDIGMEKRLEDPLYWIKRASEKVNCVNVVFTDVRFPNEVDFIRGIGGELVWISRPGVGPVNEHISESAIHSEVFDSYIHNDWGLEDLELCADSLVERITYA
jgi:hypothetical protein